MKMDTSSEEEESSGEEEVFVKKVLPTRSTRGTRQTDEHNEGDDEFWDQEFFKEEAGDEVFEASSSEEDVIDSDFDAEESEEDDAEVTVTREKKTTGSRYKDPALKRAAAAKKKLATGAASSTTAAKTIGKKRKAPLGERKVSRRSSRATTVQRTQSTDSTLAARKKKPKISRPKVTFRVYTQAELLAEAEQTTLKNRASLEAFLRDEEAIRKQRSAKNKAKKITGPYTVITKGKEQNTVAFMNYDKKDHMNGYPTGLFGQ